MNKEEILAMEAGRELDALIGLKLGLVKPNIAEAFQREAKELDERAEKYEMKNLLPNYSTDISAAWEVIVLFKEQMLFSKREKLFKELRGLLKTKDGYFIEWPSALMFLEPQHICKAALLAVMDS